MTSSPPPQILRHLLKRPRRQAHSRAPHTRSHCLDLKFSGLDEGRNVEVAILIESFVRRLSKNGSGSGEFDAFGIATVLRRSERVLAFLRA